MISSAQLVDVRTRVEEGDRRFHMAFPGGVDQSRESTLASHVLSEGTGPNLRVTDRHGVTAVILGRIVIREFGRFPTPSSLNSGLDLPGIGSPAQIVRRLLFLESLEDAVTPPRSFPVRTLERRDIDNVCENRGVRTLVEKQLNEVLSWRINFVRME